MAVTPPRVCAIPYNSSGRFQISDRSTPASFATSSNLRSKSGKISSRGSKACHQQYVRLSMEFQSPRCKRVLSAECSPSGTSRIPHLATGKITERSVPMTMIRRTLNSATPLLGDNEKDTIPFKAAAACVPTSSLSMFVSSSYSWWACVSE